jgi:hypothetical protein
VLKNVAQVEEQEFDSEFQKTVNNVDDFDSPGENYFGGANFGIFFQVELFTS